MSEATRLPCIVFLIHRMGIGGIERQIVERLKGLNESKRFRVILATLESEGELLDEAGKFAQESLILRRRVFFDVLPVISLIRYARVAQVTMIEAFDWVSCLIGLVAARYLRIPFVHSGIQSAIPPSSIRERINYLCALGSDAIVANSQAGLDAFGLDRHPLARVIHNGLDFHRFENIRPECYSEPTICMVANFSIYKDHLTVIKAMALINKTFSQAKLMLIGNDLGTYETCQRLVEELGLTSTIQVFAQILYPASIIVGSDICVLASSQGEGISNAILEYMALGKPVVATDCPGNREVVIDGKTGYLVPGFSPEALADSVIRLLQSPDQACQMGNQGSKRVREMFSLQRMHAEYEAIYQEFLCEDVS